MPLPTSFVVKNGSNARAASSLRHPAAGVADRHDDKIAGRQAGFPALTQGDIFAGDDEPTHSVHRVAGVGGEVEDRGLELRRVDVTGPDLGLQPLLDLDPLAEGALAQNHSLAQDVVDVDDLRADLLPPRKGEQLLVNRAPRTGRAQRTRWHSGWPTLSSGTIVPSISRLPMIAVSRLLKS